GGTRGPEVHGKPTVGCVAASARAWVCHAARACPKATVLFRYDKIKHLRKLRTLGEINLRCGSTEDSANDFARNDANELCTQLHLSANELDMDLSSDAPRLQDDAETLAFKIYQKTDFFMFCLS